MSNGKDMTVHLIVGSIKKTLNEIPRMQFHCIKMSQYFSKPFRSFGQNVNVKFDLSNYATKNDLKNVTQNDTDNLASLKTEVDKLDIDKFVPVPVNLSKVRDVVKNDVVKKAVYDKLAAKVNNIRC